MSITHQKTLEVWSLPAPEHRLQAYNWTRVSTENISQALEKSDDIHRGEHERKRRLSRRIYRMFGGALKTSVVYW
jgi:hypothetical protein